VNIFKAVCGFSLLSLPVVPGHIAMSQPAPLERSGEATETPEISSAQSDHFQAAFLMASRSVGGLALSPAVQQVMREQLLQEFAENEDFQELEQGFPGVTLAVVDAVLPVAVRQTEQNTPALIERLATLYAAEMTAAEIAEATEWFSGAAFSRWSAAMESNLDLSKIIRDSITDTETQISSEDLDTIQNDSAARSASTMELVDRAALMRFSETPAFAKLEALKPRSMAIETAWSNEDKPDDTAEIEHITIKTLEEFTGLDLSE